MKFASEASEPQKTDEKRKSFRRKFLTFWMGNWHHTDQPFKLANVVRPDDLTNLVFNSLIDLWTEFFFLPLPTTLTPGCCNLTNNLKGECRWRLESGNKMLHRPNLASRIQYTPSGKLTLTDLWKSAFKNSIRRCFFIKLFHFCSISRCIYQSIFRYLSNLKSIFMVKMVPQVTGYNSFLGNFFLRCSANWPIS